MAKIELGGQTFFVPDEIAGDPTKTQPDILKAAIPWSEYEQSLLDSKMAGGLAIAGEAFMEAVDEICVQTGRDITVQLPPEFFSKYDNIFEKLYKAGLIPSKFLALNKDSLSEAFDQED